MLKVLSCGTDTDMDWVAQCLRHSSVVISMTLDTKSLMVSIGESKLRWMGLIFLDHEVKISNAYYDEMLLPQELLCVMDEISDKLFLFQQLFTAYWACNAVSHLDWNGMDLPTFILPDLWSLKSRDEIQWEMWQWRCKMKVYDVDELMQCLIDVWHGLVQSVINGDWVAQLYSCMYQCQVRTFWASSRCARKRHKKLVAKFTAESRSEIMLTFSHHLPRYAESWMFCFDSQYSFFSENTFLKHSKSHRSIPTHSDTPF